MKVMEILLVEDNPADVLLTCDAFDEADFPHHLHHAQDGVEALVFLRGEGSHAQSARPDVILMDLNMPRMSGLELLDILKVDADLRRIPVIVLIASRLEAGIWRGRNLHATAYLVKPVSFGEFMEVVRTLDNAGALEAALPPGRHP